MHSAYFEVRFRAPAALPEWPEEFVVVTAWATTGQRWDAGESAAADQHLARELAERHAWHTRLTGFSPKSGHAEPGWAVELPLAEGRDLGRRYLQDAIYYVRGDDLFVTHCDARGALVPVGRFRERLEFDAEAEPRP